ncbi:hypothetical protein Syun_014948 [Stephania yunnanensis]|uniref:Late embryogenesis abundant protein, LEA-18 n=1 Tax=Stephania yunnanensis TaxID=152371 RepID=A0AAP0JM05_9MAGN
MASLKEEHKSESGAEKENTEAELPMQSSPYVKYSDLEDYKRQGYGTEGHIEPKPDQGGGATDAPTLSGQGLTQGDALAADAIASHCSPLKLN